MNCANHPEMSATAYCRTCGKALCATCTRDVRGVIYCEECLAARLSDTVPPRPAAAFASPVPPGAPVVVVRRGGNPVLAALLSIIPGVGQMYNEQYAKGLIFVLIFAATIQLTASGFGVIGAFAITGFYCFQIIDAYNTARARQLGQPLPDPFGINELLGGKGRSTASAPTPAAAVSADASYVPPGTPVTGVPPDQGAPPPDHPAGPPIGAVVLIVLGGLFLLNSVGAFEFDWAGRLWPLILIGVGAWIFIRRRNVVQR